MLMLSVAPATADVPPGGGPPQAVPGAAAGIVPPQLGGDAAPTPYLPHSQDGTQARPGIERPGGQAMPPGTAGVTAVPPAEDKGPDGRRVPGLPDGIPPEAWLSGRPFPLTPDELVKRLEELARQPMPLAETAGPAVLDRAGSDPGGEGKKEGPPGHDRPGEP